MRTGRETVKNQENNTYKNVLSGRISMGVSVRNFGTTADGREASIYSITNGGVTAEVTDFGAVLVNLFVPDRNGRTDDVVLGFDDLAGYEVNGCFYGAVILPSCNRIGGASFELDGVRYQLPVNDGKNNLHTDHDHGSHKRIWDAVTGDHSVTFTLKLGDGELYTPGNRTFQITYSVLENGTLRLEYRGTSDRRTLINATNHSYFNLSGRHDFRKVYDTWIRLHCSAFTPVLPGAIPTGEIRKVSGTPFDFLKGKTIGQEIGADDGQLRLVGGYDHNFVIDGWTDKARLGREEDLLPVAEAQDSMSGRRMECWSTLPGVQFYAGNFAAGKGKDGRNYSARDGFCLETQYYPDAVHHETFPQPVFGPEEEYHSITEYRFSTI